MKKTKFLLGAMALFLGMTSCTDYTEHDLYNPTYPTPDGKSLYRPKDFSGQDWSTENFDYSYQRAAYTDNLAIFWQKGFGNDLSSPPSLEGTDMSVDLENLKTQLEKFYSFYRDDLGFHMDNSKADKYRMMVMLQYSLEGTAYGGAYDNTIGAFWAAPNRLKDQKLNTVAHELGHSFQLQMQADGAHGFDNQFVDEMYDCYARLVNFDFDRVRDITRKYANSFPSAIPYMNEIGDGWYQVDPSHCPENYGFNALKLEVPAAGATVSVDFNNIMGNPDYTCEWWWCGNYRVGFVGVTESGKSIYGEVGKADYDNREATVSFTAPEGEKLAHLWLVVTAGPKDGHWTLAQQPLAQWPYQVKFNGTKLI